MAHLVAYDQGFEDGRLLMVWLRCVEFFDEQVLTHDASII